MLASRFATACKGQIRLTEGDQLWGDLPECTETLGDSVCCSVVSEAVFICAAVHGWLGLPLCSSFCMTKRKLACAPTVPRWQHAATTYGNGSLELGGGLQSQSAGLVEDLDRASLDGAGDCLSAQHRGRRHSKSTRREHCGVICIGGSGDIRGLKVDFVLVPAKGRNQTQEASDARERHWAGRQGRAGQHSAEPSEQAGCGALPCG